MFENLVASISPKSFNLERYFSKSKRLTKINTKLATVIKQKLDDSYSIYNRSGHLVSATSCSGTIVCVNDPLLAKALYVAVTSEGFDEKLNAAYTNIKCFSDMKFFINKKEQEVVFVYYNCTFDRSKDFLSSVYDSLGELISLFSTSEYVVYVNYYDFFIKFLNGGLKTSFVTAFFTSIISDTYSYTPDEMQRIVCRLLNYDCLSLSVKTLVPGMYLNDVDEFLESSIWPRNICINMLRYVYDKNAFNSYDEFFRKTSTDNMVLHPTNILTSNFVFDENVLQDALTLSSDTPELTTWTVKNSWNDDKHIVIKIKDMKHASAYLANMTAWVKSGFLYKFAVAPTASMDSVYLYFSVPTSISLEDEIQIEDCASVTSTMQYISKRNWLFTFKADAPLLKCFRYRNSTIYLDPLYIHHLDYGNTGKVLDYKLIILSIIQEFVKSHNIQVDNIFTCCFMKILPPNFAQNVISYLKTGTLLDEDTNNWGDILSFEKFTNIRFLDNIGRINPDRITFFPCVNSDSRVKKIVSKKSLHLKNDYINSPECLQYISDIGLELTDENLAKIFASTESFYLSPSYVIVSKDLCVSNSYQIVGVIWNACNLTTIGELIQGGKVDTPTFYKLLSSVLSLQQKHRWLIDESNICQMLVGANHKVFLNYNGLKHSRYNGRDSNKTHFNNLFNALAFHINTSLPFERFSYDELYDNGKRTSARDVLLCTEHNLYYVEGSLCVECRKIFCVIDNPPSSCLYNKEDWYFYTVSLNHSLLAANCGRTLTPHIIQQCKMGIENGLYDKFFFKPDSLAFHNNKVIGVMFFERKNFNFKNLLPISMFEARQRLQVIQVIYKKLLPLILDGSCVVKTMDFFDSIAMHKDYKGELIILKLPIMDCEAILAKDKNAITNTVEMFAEFLVNYIKSDHCLNVASNVNGSCICELIQDINSCKFTSRILEECVSAFCNVHNMPFSSNNTICPLCIADGISAEDTIILPATHFEQLQKAKPLFEGGEATLYVYSNEQIQKLFKPGVDLGFKSKIIGKSLQKRALFKSFNSTHTDIKFITIDKVLFESNGKSIRLKGFIQEQIDDSFKISRLKDKEFVASQGYSRQDITEILIKVCIGIEFLHSIGGYIGDLNGGNILIRDKTVYFIDMDGMSFDEVKNFVYTDMYIYPPSAENKNITKADDWYSLAVQAFYYFTYAHPFRGMSSSRLVPSDEITRMKDGISVLGNHDIKPPNISIGWDFMPKELIQFFKSTFEGGKRESMRNILEQFKTSLNNLTPDSSMKFTEVIRSSPCQFALSYNTYIDTSGFLVWCEQKLLKFSSGKISCKIADNYIVLTTPNNSVVLNDSTGHFNIYSAISNDDSVYAANGKLYYISSLDNNVHVKQISSKTHQEEDGIVVSTFIPFDFLVTDEHKFIFLVKESTNVHIYCNLEELTSVTIANLDENMKSHLFYDSESGNYLVLLADSHETKGVLISSDGSYSEFCLDEQVSKSSCFYKNTLYYMLGDKICFYNVISGTKKEVTSKFSASGCLIERSGNKFVICSEGKTYMYTKS